MSLPSYSTLDELIDIYTKRLNGENKNRERIKKFYHNEESFDNLMNKLVTKDYIRFQKFIQNVLNNKAKQYPTPWKTFSVILDIVQNEGEEIPPFDILTRSHQSKNMKYMGWTFSWVHGAGTLISIFDRNDELVYRF